MLDSLEAHRKRILEADEKVAEKEAEPIRSPLDGHEIMSLAGREPGPWVGQLKDYLDGQVASGELTTGDKEQAAEMARQWLARALS